MIWRAKYSLRLGNDVLYRFIIGCYRYRIYTQYLAGRWCSSYRLACPERGKVVKKQVYALGLMAALWAAGGRADEAGDMAPLRLTFVESLDIGVATGPGQSVFVGGSFVKLALHCARCGGREGRCGSWGGREADCGFNFHGKLRCAPGADRSGRYGLGNFAGYPRKSF